MAIPQGGLSAYYKDNNLQVREPLKHNDASGQSCSCLDLFKLARQSCMPLSHTDISKFIGKLHWILVVIGVNFKSGVLSSHVHFIPRIENLECVNHFKKMIQWDRGHCLIASLLLFEHQKEYVVHWMAVETGQSSILLGVLVTMGQKNLSYLNEPRLHYYWKQRFLLVLLYMTYNIIHTNGTVQALLGLHFHRASSGALFSSVMVPKFAMIDAWLLCQSRIGEVHHRSVLGGSSRFHVIERSINQFFTSKELNAIVYDLCDEVRLVRFDGRHNIDAMGDVL
jgi:hypothetical protein